MAIQIECPICGSMEWVVVGWTQPLIISRLRCAVCWYEERYVEPKERKVCESCDIEKNQRIGREDPKWNTRFKNKCPECSSRIHLFYDEKESRLEIKCRECEWKENIKC